MENTTFIFVNLSFLHIFESPSKNRSPREILLPYYVRHTLTTFENNLFTIFVCTGFLVPGRRRPVV